VRLYVIEEPEPGKSKVDYAWRLDFEYPEGPRDAEAIAVDVENQRVLVLTKSDIPALLYSVPLVPDSKKRQSATRLGAVGSLPQPTRSEVEFAAKTDSWHWQPTSMDITEDESHAVILTYGGVYLYYASTPARSRQQDSQPPGGGCCLQRKRRRHFHNTRTAQCTAIPLTD